MEKIIEQLKKGRRADEEFRKELQKRGFELIDETIDNTNIEGTHVIIGDTVVPLEYVKYTEDGLTTGNRIRSSVLMDIIDAIEAEIKEKEKEEDYQVKLWKDIDEIMEGTKKNG